MAERAEAEKVISNEQVEDLLDRYAGLEAEANDAIGEFMADIKSRFRSKQKEIVDEAKDLGIKKSVFKALWGVRKSQMSLAAKVEELEDDERAQYRALAEQLPGPMGDWARHLADDEPAFS